MNPKSPKGFEHIQKILGHAMRAAAPSTWPERPHLGGPLVVLTTKSQLGVAVGLCDGVQLLVPPPDPAVFTEIATSSRSTSPTARSRPRARLAGSCRACGTTRARSVP